MYRKRVPAATRDQKFGFLFIYWKDFHIHVSSWDEVEVKGIKTYFNIDENISSEQIDAFLDNINSDNQEEIYISINDSDAEFIAEFIAVLSEAILSFFFLSLWHHFSFESIF